MLVAGLGGLGSAAAYYLAAAGVGYLRIVDRDRVELGNLNRQILHWTGDIGRFKSESAGEKLGHLNPSCQVDARCAEITDNNVEDFAHSCSAIVDGTDNLESRKALNRASLRTSTPYVFGGVEGFSGMITTFVPGETGCLECLFGHIPPQQKSVGVLGALPGVIASLQVLETIKLILGIDGVLKDRLLRVRGLDMAFHITSIGRNPDCKVCSAGKGRKNG